MLTFKELQDEIKRRATRNQGGDEFDDTVKNVINSSLFRISREAAWRVMRRRTFFTTKTTYDTASGSGTYIANSTAVNVSGANLITGGISIGRRVKLSGDSTYFTIRTITGEDDFTIDKDYTGDATSTGTYSVLGQEEYNLPIQAGHRMFMWHEEYGYPYKLEYITDQEFYESAWDNTSEAVPTYYRMWGEDMVRNQVLEPTTLRVRSTAIADTGIAITIFGMVQGYPDSETITTDGADGTTNVTGSKSFDSVERVSKAESTTGRIIVEDSSGNVEVAVIPTGDTSAGVIYKKVQLYPLPDTAFDINVQYYKDPVRLVADNDIHELGQEFDEAIILLSTVKIKAQDAQREADTTYGMWMDEIRNLRKTNMDKIDWFPTLKKPGYGLGSSRVHRNLLFRQVGPYYGSSSRR